MRLVTGYGIARYFRDQLNCQHCLRHLTEEKDDFCEEVHGEQVAKDESNSLTLSSTYLEEAFSKLEVNAALDHEYDVFYAAMNKHMVKLA
uniref:Uncharacterized protein n=1 Tax=Glossina morsitans morsitans TaxID=37546 RepID=A0ABK9NG90_GLOMM